MPNRPASMLFLGDCNTLGTPDIEGRAYPEQLALRLPLTAKNCGHTMTTTREGSEYFKTYYDKSIDALCIQYGLVDSWLTFKYSPYVLYYPDSTSRKWLRKLAKKFKKWCKALGLNKAIGTNNVVPMEEYSRRIETMIVAVAPKPVYLIETAPNKDTLRNPEIERYNQCLESLERKHLNCHLVRIYDAFAGPLCNAYSDPTHFSVEGHIYLAEQLHQRLLETQQG